MSNNLPLLASCLSSRVKISIFPGDWILDQDVFFAVFVWGRFFDCSSIYREGRESLCQLKGNDYFSRMILKNCLVVVGFWTLLVAPFLCGIGVPVHSDTCEESSECRHELQCFTDPCRILALRSVHQNGRWEHSASPVAQLNPPALVDDFAAPGQTQTELIADPAGGLSKMVVFEWSVPLLC